MISLLLLTSSFLNFIFYIYAIGFVVALGLEQIVRKGGNERDILLWSIIENISGEILG